MLSDILALFLSLVMAWQPVPKGFYRVVKVSDGDTIKVAVGDKTETVRFIGVDTPESVDPRRPVQCFGKEASKKTTEMLMGKNVRLETDILVGDRDIYKRWLRYIYLPDGTLYNKWLIAAGYGHEYTYKSNPYTFQDEFKLAEKNAREHARGLWAPDVCIK